MKTEKTMKSALIILSLLILISISVNSASAATVNNNSTIYVSTQGNDIYDGLSSEYNATTGSGPKATIKNATGTVTENGTVYIAKGTYYESGIIINKNMNIIGENQENTIINGQQTGNSIFKINKGITVTIINLTLTNATATYGGAIYNEGGLNVSNNTFTGNTATYGGAIYNEGGLNVSNSTFTGNTATYGGAIDNTNGLTVDNSTFTGNTATESGGSGGAIENGGSLTVSNSRFTSNAAISNGGSGGAIDIWGGSLNVSNSTFISNTAIRGGAINILGGSLNISNSTFTGNTATYGGAIYNRGNLNVGNSTFISNTATYGGAICNAYSTDVSVSFCRIINNGQYEIYNENNGSVDAKYNWWGSNDNPSDYVNNSVNVSPWLVLTVTSNNSTIPVGGNSTVTTDLQHDSNGTYHDPKTEGHIPDGTTVIFNLSNTSLGSLNTTSTTLTNGVATTNFTASNIGNENVTATIDNQNNSTTITNKLNTTLSVSTVTGTYGKSVGLTATLKDENNHLLEGQTVKFYVDGSLIGIATTNYDGVATLNYIINMHPGNHRLTASYDGSTDYLASKFTGSLTVNALNTTVVVGNVTIKDGQTATINATLRDGNNNPLSGQNVSFTVNGNTYIRSTNNDGVATLLYVLPHAGSYTVTASYNESTDYLASTGNGTVTVNQLNTTITVGNVSVPDGQTAIIDAWLKDENGNPVSGQDVSFTVNGKTYIRSTNNEGMAALTYTPTHAGNYPLTVQYDGNTDYLPSTSNATLIATKLGTNLTVDNVTIKDGQTATINATLKDEYNNPVSGQDVSFTVNGNTYIRSTNNDGVATLLYVLPHAGSYTVTASYNESTDYLASTGNGTVTVNQLNTTITVGNVTVQDGQTATVNATLKDENGNPLSGQEVSFTVNGTTQKETTNSNGVATLTYTPMSTGSYTVTVSYDGSTDYLASTGIGTLTVTQPNPVNPVNPVNPNSGGNGGNLGSNGNSSTVHAASVVSMQKTGVPLNYLILAVFMVLSGLIVPKRK